MLSSEHTNCCHVISVYNPCVLIVPWLRNFSCTVVSLVHCFGHYLIICFNEFTAPIEFVYDSPYPNTLFVTFISQATPNVVLFIPLISFMHSTNLIHIIATTNYHYHVTIFTHEQNSWICWVCRYIKYLVNFALLSLFVLHLSFNLIMLKFIVSWQHMQIGRVYICTIIIVHIIPEQVMHGWALIRTARV